MASYASDVRNELAHKFDTDKKCLRAELAALLDIGAVDIDNKRIFETSNAAIARKVIKLMKKIYPDTKIEVAAVRTKILFKTMKYYVRIFFSGKNNFDDENFFDSREEKISYLRGAFLANGSVAKPESYYRLDISADTKAKANFIKKILTKLRFNPCMYKRRDLFVTYLQDSESVCDFLAIIGADNAVDRFESARNLKEIHEQVNRLMNLELASLNKAVETAQKQLSDIRTLLRNHVAVNDKLREAMDVRLVNPSDTVGELAEKIYITREGLVYRFRKIHEIAEKIRSKH